MSRGLLMGIQFFYRDDGVGSVFLDHSFRERPKIMPETFAHVDKARTKQP